MCGPIGIGIITAAGSIFSGMASAAQYRGQAAVYKAEEKAKRYQAQSQANAGAYESSIKLDEGKRLTGKQVTAFAASGVDAATGTPGEVITDSASNVNMDVAAIRANWQDRANLSNYEASIAKLNQKNAKSNARSAMIGGFLNAGANMATAIGNVSPGSSVSKAMTSFG